VLDAFSYFQSKRPPNREVETVERAKVSCCSSVLHCFSCLQKRRRVQKSKQGLALVWIPTHSVMQTSRAPQTPRCMMTLTRCACFVLSAFCALWCVDCLFLVSLSGLECLS